MNLDLGNAGYTESCFEWKRSLHAYEVTEEIRHCVSEYQKVQY